MSVVATIGMGLAAIVAVPVLAGMAVVIAGVIAFAFTRHERPQFDDRTSETWVEGKAGRHHEYANCANQEPNNG